MDIQTARKEAHTLKGGALSIGGRPLAQKAFEVEQAVKEENMKATLIGFELLEKEFRAFRNCAARFIDSFKKRRNLHDKKESTDTGD